MCGEGVFIDLYQAHLPDGCRRLQFMHGVRPPAPAQPLHAAGDGARRHQHHFLALLSQIRNLPRPFANGFEIEAGAVVGDEGRADLDDKAAGGG